LTRIPKFIFLTVKRAVISTLNKRESFFIMLSKISMKARTMNAHKAIVITIKCIVKLRVCVKKAKVVLGRKKPAFLSSSSC